jgi:hypothetical protein
MPAAARLPQQQVAGARAALALACLSLASVPQPAEGAPTQLVNVSLYRVSPLSYPGVTNRARANPRGSRGSHRTPWHPG